jgi:segregation and condensation protein B
MAIIAYHQPATRAEIEAVRGVSVSPGTLDALLELGWVRPRGRRRAPGRPLVYVTTEEFLEHFSLESLEDLPGKADLKAAGLLSEDAPDDFEVPDPTIGALQDELPLEDEPEGPEAEFQTDYMEGAEAEASEEGEEDEESER